MNGFDELFTNGRSYRVGEVAERLGYHVDTVRRWTNEGRLGCIWIGKQRRIPYQAIWNFASPNFARRF